ncbi:metallophosphoesterase family protein [Hymenobacter sp. M29]|uniref:Metallophosphoesterase family protein n=1 Tax=Hymenobacter mellowenesis TaxID=3063995 RepID=A0ABT9AE79_9BACT|nr:metallophosphoesterase family protein [Hymenobacter sp. M29]MDO7848140.1 metallophosphoesterase family protein [Hymenobacter sp. M29]
MNLFIIGDVHGCFHTFQELLKRWDPTTDHLIQVGDLVDRGAHTPATVELARELNEKYPDTTTFLMGNHEDAMLHHYAPHGPYPGWLKWGGRSTTEQYRAQPTLLARHLPWLKKRPVLWQNEHVLVSHAGIGPSESAYDPDSSDGLLWARGPLRRLGKLQVVGHTPMSDGEPILDPDSHTMYIDTGAVFGGNLTGLRLSPTGAVLDIVLIPVFPQDLLEKPRFSYLTPQ